MDFNKYLNNDLEIEEELKSKKDYFDTILEKIDPNIFLDDEQRKVIVTNASYNLVIAGAGSGKTTCICSKIKYLVDFLNIKSEEILLISFTNKTVDELIYKINNLLGINCFVTTFHSLGKKIIDKYRRINVLNSNKKFIYEYLTKDLLSEEFMNKVIIFFSKYFKNINFQKDLDKNKLGNELSLCLRRSVYDNFTITQIANFLYLNNINFYNKKEYMYNTGFIYTPCFEIFQDSKTLYIEYVDNINLIKKINKIHKKFKTKCCIITKDDDYKKLIEDFLKSNNFLINRRKVKDIYSEVVDSKNHKYLIHFTNILSRFIQNFKCCGYSYEKLDEFINDTKNPYILDFLDIIKIVYYEYELYLKNSNLIDFEDMINLSTNLIKNNLFLDFNYKYIIIDEFQDISNQRFDLIKALIEKTKAKLFCVGDDWQSIYGFAGSKLSLFTNFFETFPDGVKLVINTTYRSSQQLIDIAGGFIQKNKDQIKKKLISFKSLDNPIKIFTYNVVSDDKLLQYNKEKALKDIIDVILEKDKKPNILLVGRYNFDINFINGYYFDVLDNFIYYKNIKLTFLTAHTAKGLTFDYVVIINATNTLYGFPSKVINEVYMDLVVSKDYLNEERRLWYGVQLLYETF